MNSTEWFFASLGTILLIIGLITVFFDSVGWWLVSGAVASYLLSAAFADRRG